MKLRLDIAAIWLVLLTAPFWLPLVHGYEALGTRVLVLGLAAMSLNFLLGFTGVLSFGHAAYFGLGAYGAGLTLKLLAPSTPLAIVLGMLLGTVAGAALGALIARRRGVYFAMVTIAFGQVFYFIAFRWNALTGGDDGLRGFSRQPIDLGFFTLDILNKLTAFYYFVLACFALALGIMAFLLRSPFGRTLLAIRENERRARFLGIPVEQHIWLSFVIRSTPCSTTSPIPRGCTTPSPATSSSWRCSAACDRSGDRCSAPPSSSSCRIICRASRRTGSR